MNAATVNSGTVIGIVIAALAIIAIVVWYAVARRHRTESLRSQYGSEYDRTVAHSRSRRVAEAELDEREERVDRFDIRPLSAEQRDLFDQRWRDVQEMFVDNPGRAVTRADDLVGEVMRTRGYPVADFEQRASDLSVHHGVFVRNYRAARDVAERNRVGAATTEELRRAMVFYRELFEDLLQSDEAPGERQVNRAVERDVPMSGDGDRTRSGERVRPVAPPRSDREAR